MSHLKKADFYKARFRGGPTSGIRFFPRALMPWPLPEVIPAPDGEYRKISESESQHVAEYDWTATVGAEEVKE